MNNVTDLTPRIEENKAVSLRKEVERAVLEGTRHISDEEVMEFKRKIAEDWPKLTVKDLLNLMIYATTQGDGVTAMLCQGALLQEASGLLVPVTPSTAERAQSAPDAVAYKLFYKQMLTPGGVAERRGK